MAPTVTRRSSRAEGNLEGHNGSPATRARRCLLSVGGDCMVTSRHKSQDVARAHHRQVRGRRVRYVREFVPPAHCQGWQQCLQGRVLSQDIRGSELSSSSDKNQKENRGRVVKSQVKIQPLYCDCDLCNSWLVMMTVSLADVIRAGNVGTKLRTTPRVRYAASFLLYCLPLSDILSLNSDHWVKANHRE